jgi:hypothetical protein
MYLYCYKNIYYIYLCIFVNDLFFLLINNVYN